VAYYYDDTLDDPFTFDLSNDSYAIGPTLDIPTGSFIQCKDKSDQYYVYQGNNKIQQAYYAYLEASANALVDIVSDCSEFIDITSSSNPVLDLPTGTFIKCGTAPINGLPGPDNKPPEGAIQHNNKYSWKNAIYQYHGRDSDNKPSIRWIPTSDIGASLTYDSNTNTYGKAYNDKPFIIDCEKNGFYRDSAASSSGKFAVPKDVTLNYESGTLVSCKSAPYKDTGETGDLSGIYDINTNVYVFKKGATTYDATKIKEYEKTNIPGTLSWIPTINLYNTFFTNPSKNQDWDNPIVISCNENKIPRDVSGIYYSPDTTALYKDGNNIYYIYIGLNNTNQKTQFEAINGTNAYLFNSDYFGTNPTKQFINISLNSNSSEVLTSMDIAASKGWTKTANLYFRFSDDVIKSIYRDPSVDVRALTRLFFRTDGNSDGKSKTYFYREFDSSTNTNRIMYFYTDSDPSIPSKFPSPVMIPTNYGGWIVEDGQVRYSFGLEDSLIFLQNRYRFQNVTATDKYFNDLDSKTLTCTTNINGNFNTLFYLYKLNNGDVFDANMPLLIKNVSDNKWLNHTAGTDNVNGVQIFNGDTGNYSIWNLIKQDDGSYGVRNLATGKFIECDSTNTDQIYCRSTTINNYSKWNILDGLTTDDEFWSNIENNQGSLVGGGGALAGGFGSDYRLKCNIKNIDEYSCLKFDPVQYDMYGKHRFGFIAHELQKHIPCLVNGVKDGPTMQSVNYIDIIAILVKDIQRLNNRIECLEKKKQKKYNKKNIKKIKGVGKKNYKSLNLASEMRSSSS
jgi:hypothetical protein